MIPELFKSVTGSVVRWLLTSTFAVLVAHNVITNDQSNAVLLWLTGAVAVLLWGIVQKLRAWTKLDAALGLPANSTVEDQNKSLK